MKKILLMTALAAGVLASCSEDDLGTQSSVDNNTIAFATKGSNSMTRAGVSITSIDQFTVSAVNDDKTSYFSNEEYTYKTGSGVFQSQTPHYWPTTGTLSFYAISDPGTHSVDGDNIPSYSYSSWAAERDLVAATVLSGQKQIPYPLTFKHLTSQILVTAEAENKTEELTYRLTSVKLTTPSTGTYSFATQTGGVGSWAIDNSKTSTYSYNSVLPKTCTQSGTINLSGCYWNILPNTTGNLTFEIGYQVLQNGKIISDNTGVSVKTCTVEQPNLVAGKRYVYNFVLGISTQDEITFSVNISDWENGQGGNVSPGA